MTATKVVTDESFETDVLKNEKPVIVEYWAQWCPPCRQLAPVLEAIGTELAGDVDVVKLNINENPRVAREYGIMLVPTLNLFSGGEVVRQVIGARSKSALLRDFDGYM
jgi:thioredoxin 1